jgi:hypothetical protein
MPKKLPSGRKVATIIVGTVLVTFPLMVMAYKAVT